MIWEALFQKVAATRLVRRVVDTVLRGRARRRVAELDHESAARSQVRTLLGLVHRAQATRFGQDHDFQRIRTVGDFQRLVPLRTLSRLWQEYWPAPQLLLSQTTWPILPFLALPETPGDWLSSVPLSADVFSTFGTAALTALGLIGQARPRTRLLTGQTVVLGKEAEPEAFDGITSAPLEPLLVQRLPAVVRPAVLGPLDPDRKDSPRLEALCAGASRLPVTCVVGGASRLHRLFARLKERTGRKCVADVWPDLAAVLYGRDSSGVDRARLAEATGSDAVVLLETWCRPEGVIAIEDPRQGLLRLLPDQGVFFEFVPQEQLGQPRPIRHTVAEVEPGVPYALALTSVAGVWACVVDGRVCFDHREPPLLRRLEQPAPEPVPPASPAHPFPVRPPHPWNGARVPDSGTSPHPAGGQRAFL